MIALMFFVVGMVCGAGLMAVYFWQEGKPSKLAVRIVNPESIRPLAKSLKNDDQP